VVGRDAKPTPADILQAVAPARARHHDEDGP